VFDPTLADSVDDTSVRCRQRETKAAFLVRIGNGTREITDQGEKQKYIAHRWASQAL
jgi:hypothetical protein